MDETLFSSSSLGDIAKLKRAIFRGANINRINPSGRDCAEMAAFNGQIQVYDYLVAHPDFQHKDRKGVEGNGHAAMTIALHNNQLEMVKHLVENHDIKLRDITFPSTTRIGRRIAASTYVGDKNPDLAQYVGKVEYEETKDAQRSLTTDEMVNLISFGPEDLISWPKVQDPKIYYSFQTPKFVKPITKYPSLYKEMNSKEKNIFREVVDREFSRTDAIVEEISLSDKDLRNLARDKTEKKVIFISIGLPPIKKGSDNYGITAMGDKSPYRVILFPEGMLENKKNKQVSQLSILHEFMHASISGKHPDYRDSREDKYPAFDSTLNIFRAFPLDVTVMSRSLTEEGLKCRGVKNDGLSLKETLNKDECDHTYPTRLTEVDIAAVNKEWRKITSDLSLGSQSTSQATSQVTENKGVSSTSDNVLGENRADSTPYSNTAIITAVTTVTVLLAGFIAKKLLNQTHGDDGSEVMSKSAKRRNKQKTKIEASKLDNHCEEKQRS